jgi:dTDP-4-dehydrorhamnose 3,5-epimerase
MTRFIVTELPLRGLRLLTRQRMGDSRGFLSRLFCAEDLKEAGWNKPIAQVNHTFTARAGTVRGLHYQLPPSLEMKLVTCLRGEVWDVAVDVRAGSPTFLHWHAERLSAENGHCMLLPEGFAHGFQTLAPDVEMLYCHSAPYLASSEGGLHPRDPELAIPWPMPIAELSVRDDHHPMLDAQYKGITA